MPIAVICLDEIWKVACVVERIIIIAKVILFELAFEEEFIHIPPLPLRQ